MPKLKVSWRHASGGLLGNVGPNATVTTAFSTPTDELWIEVGPGPSGFVNGAWTTVAKRTTLRFRAGQWQRANYPSEFGCSFFVWHQQQVWGFGLQIVAIFRDNEWQVLPTPPFAQAACALSDSAGQLWVGTWGQGLWRTTDGRVWEQLDLPGEGNSISALWLNADQSLWLAESGQSPSSRPVHWLQAGQWHTLPLPTKPASFREVNALAVDHNGLLWAATRSFGIWCWSGSAWKRYGTTTRFRHGSGLPGGGLRAGLAVDASGRIWTADGHGIGVYAGEVWRCVVVVHDAEASEGIGSGWTPYWPPAMTMGPGGRLWMGTLDGDIGWIDTKRPVLPPEEEAWLPP